MKKTLYLLLLLMLAIRTGAQMPEQKSRAVVFKFTETWCGPCGTWGWNLGNLVADSIGDNGYYVGVMGSSGDSMNANCWSSFQNNFILNGYPTFVVNDYKTLDFFSSIKEKYEQFAAAEPLASPAGFMSITGNDVTVQAKARFWTATSGDFYLAAFLIEDKVKEKQLGQTGIVEHHSIMRGSMMTNLSPWGEALVTGPVAAQDEYSRNFSMALKPYWVKANLSVLLVVYQKVGDKYLLVNAVKAKSQPTSIAARKTAPAITLFPNPVSDVVNLRIAGAGSGKIWLSICDVTGRQVVPSREIETDSGTQSVSIPVPQLPNGTYSIRIGHEQAEASERFVITR